MNSSIAAIVLAAGLSLRMGHPKMTLPWGDTTVLGQVIEILIQAGLDDIVVVTGGARTQVENVLEGLPARPVFNARFEQDHMALSLSAGLAALSATANAALVALGDQPQIEAYVIARLLEAYHEYQPPLVFPSFQMRRGHPWIIARPLWDGIMALEPPETLRDFLRAYSEQIHYVAVESDTIFRDLDTPGDYLRERPPSTPP